MTYEQALEKVKKLLNMTKENGASEGEVVNAVKLAQTLMAKFHIEEKALVDESEEVSDIKVSQSTKTPSSNLCTLAVILAKHFRCMVYRSRFSLHILGTPVDAEIFKNTLEFAYQQFIKLSGKFIESFPDRSSKTRAKNSYLLGFSRGILAALEENEAQYALVLVVPGAVTKYAEEELHLSRGSKSSKQFDDSGNAFAQGYQDGKSLMKDKGQKLLA